LSDSCLVIYSFWGKSDTAVAAEHIDQKQSPPKEACVQSTILHKHLLKEPYMETTEQTSGKQIDLLSVGPVSLDTNVSFDGKEEKNLGGAVIYGGWAAAQCGFKTVIVTTANASEC